MWVIIMMPHSWSLGCFWYFLQPQKYAGNMSKCPLSAEIFARRVGVVRTTQMTNSQVCFCHSSQYMMSPWTLDDWRKPSNKQSWSLPLTTNFLKETFRSCMVVWKIFNIFSSPTTTSEISFQRTHYALIKHESLTIIKGSVRVSVCQVISSFLN